MKLSTHGPRALPAFDSAEPDLEEKGNPMNVFLCGMLAGLLLALGIIEILRCLSS